MDQDNEPIDVNRLDGLNMEQPPASHNPGGQTTRQTSNIIESSENKTSDQITSSNSDNRSTSGVDQRADGLKYPSRDGTYLSQFYNQPIVTTLTSFSQVAHLVKNPYELINNVDEFVRHASGGAGNTRRKQQQARDSENFAKMLNQNRHSLSPTDDPAVQEMDTFVASTGNKESPVSNADNQGVKRTSSNISEERISESSPVPVLPPIEASYKSGRLEALTIEEYEDKFRTKATDIELIERVFAGSMACNQLRAALWPYLFGIVQHRGRFQKITDSGGHEVYIFIEHESNNSRWRELHKLYDHYQAQWKAILPDQEIRFSEYRERKSLIERDVIRCDRLHPFYADEPQNLAKLSDLLITYMMYDFDIGYVQGMSDLAGPILYMYNGDLVKAFWIFVEVMKLFRRNFERSQKTIHFQLSCLSELIKCTDPVFAQYLDANETSNCFFAFRAIVCQFKRELMKEDEDDYSKVLFLWDTIWCVQRRVDLKKDLDELNRLAGNDIVDVASKATDKDVAKTSPITQQPTTCENSPFIFHFDQTHADSPRHGLTETEIFVLALCLSMIRRERDIVLANRLDSTDIHLHYIDPKLSSDLNGFIEHARNIYSYLKNDFDITRLISKVGGLQAEESQEEAKPDESSPTSADMYDSMSDFLIINGASGT